MAFYYTVSQVLTTTYPTTFIVLISSTTTNGVLVSGVSPLSLGDVAAGEGSSRGSNARDGGNNNSSQGVDAGEVHSEELDSGGWADQEIDGAGGFIWGAMDNVNNSVGGTASANDVGGEGGGDGGGDGHDDTGGARWDEVDVAPVIEQFLDGDLCEEDPVSEEQTTTSENSSDTRLRRVKVGSKAFVAEGMGIDGPDWPLGGGGSR